MSNETDKEEKIQDGVTLSNGVGITAEVTPEAVRVGAGYSTPNVSVNGTLINKNENYSLENIGFEYTSEENTLSLNTNGEQANLNYGHSSENFQMSAGVTYDKNNVSAVRTDVSANTGGYFLNSQFETNPNGTNFSIGGTNNQQLAQQGIATSMDNLLSADYQQKMELLNDPKSSFSFAQTIQYNQETPNLSQATSLMWKGKGETPSILQFKQETNGDNISVSATYDSSKINGKYNFTKIDEETTNFTHNLSGQYKNNSTIIQGEVSHQHTSPNPLNDNNSHNNLTINTTTYTNRTPDLNFKQGLYTENSARLDINDGNWGSMAISNTTGYNSFTENGTKSGYIASEYTRDFQNNGHGIYGRTGIFAEKEKFTAETYVAGEYTTNNIGHSHSIAVQGMGFFRPSDKTTAHVTARYENTFTNPFNDKAKRDKSFNIETGLNYKVGNNVTLNTTSNYSTGGENKGFSGSLGVRINL